MIFGDFSRWGIFHSALGDPCGLAALCISGPCDQKSKLGFLKISFSVFINCQGGIAGAGANLSLLWVNYHFSLAVVHFPQPLWSGQCVYLQCVYLQSVYFQSVSLQSAKCVPNDPTECH